MKQIAFPNVFDSNQKSLPLLVEFNHDGFWDVDEKGYRYNTDVNCDRNSVIVSKDCLFSIYKIALRHLLLSMDVIQPDDVVLPNLIPYLNVRKNKYDPNSIYDSIKKRKFLITQKNILVEQNSLSLMLDQQTDLRILLICDKNITLSVDLAEVFIKVIQLLNAHPDFIKEYAKLEDFGKNEVAYWYSTKSLYPNNIVMPKKYTIVDDRKVSSAGSIL
jgi:hypothetical protein